MMTKAFSLAVLASLTVSFGAGAATVRNSDAEVQSITITEKGVRTEQSVGASATITVCATGCFIVFPNGEMLPLAGPEKVVIENGVGRVVSN